MSINEDYLDKLKAAVQDVPQTTGYVQTVQNGYYQPYQTAPAPCPTCGRCPTCGSGHYAQPYITYTTAGGIYGR